MTVRSPVTKRSKRTRAELARAAHDEIAENGTVNVEAIAESAGVSPATFYAHFATHDDAIAAALDISLIEIVGVTEKLFRIETLVEDGIDAALTKLIAKTHGAFRKESAVLRAAQARMSSHQLSRDVYRGHEARSIEHVTRQIERGQEAGLFREGPADKRAMSLLLLIQGLHNPLIMKKRLDPLLANDLHRAVRAVIG